MIERLFVNVLEVSLTVSPVLLLLFLFSRRISSAYSAKWSYFVWLLLAVRLILPFNFTFPSAPVAIEVPAKILQPIAGGQTVFGASSQTMGQSAAAEAPASAISSPAVFSVLQIVTLLWICGAVLFLFFHFAGYALFLHRVKHWRRPAAASMLKIFSQKKQAMGIQKDIPLYTCTEVDSPMLVGFFKPMILLPDCPVTSEELQVILTHELIHYKRHDLWYQLLLLAANAMHWFNPLAYWMLRRADNDLELLCDEVIVKNQSTDFRKTYGEAMLVYLSQRKRHSTVLQTNFLGGSKAMKQRFIRLYDNKKRKNGFALLVLVGCVTVFIGAFVACTSNPLSGTDNSSSTPAGSASSSTNPSSASVSSAVSSTSSKSTKTTQTAANSSKAAASSSASNNIAEKTKDYILGGQGDIPEASKLQWSPTFLNQVDIDAVYKEYLAKGGKANDIAAFAKYLTENAPVPSNWKTLFEADLQKEYGEKVSRYESLGGNLYQAYVIKDGKEVPYVAVNSRTGYFHG